MLLLLLLLFGVGCGGIEQLLATKQDQINTKPLFLLAQKTDNPENLKPVISENEHEHFY